jgi:hypothetical protein
MTGASTHPLIPSLPEPVGSPCPVALRGTACLPWIGPPCTPGDSLQGGPIRFLVAQPLAERDGTARGPPSPPAAESKAAPYPRI